MFGEYCGASVRLMKVNVVMLKNLFTKEYLQKMLELFGAALVGVGLTPPFGKRSVLVCCVGCFLASVGKGDFINEIKKLQEKLRFAELQIERLKNPFTKRLEDLARKLDFGAAERITIFLLNLRNDSLTKIWRYSQSTDLESSGRDVYPKNEGCIGKALSNGDQFVDDLPDPETSFEAYVDRHKAYAMTADTLKSLPMKSRTIAAKAINDGRHNVGVIVFESLRPKAFVKKQIDKLYGQTNKELVGFVRAMRIDPDFAKKEGF